MQQQLISHSPDLKRLEDEGYNLEISGGQYLIAHHIPYLNPQMEVKYGSLVCVLTLATPTKAGSPADHTMYFVGEKPHNADGTPLKAIINNSVKQQLTQQISVDHFFSSKPLSGKYANYYEKIRTYAEILGSQARVIDPMVSPKTKKC